MRTLAYKQLLFNKQSLEAFLIFDYQTITNMNNGNFNANYWNERYLSNNTGWDIGYPSPPLKDYIDSIHDKHLKILIPGAGNAYEAEYLIEQGFKNTWIVDISEEACKNIKKNIPKLNKDQAVNADFFDFEGSFDLVLEQTFFCALSPNLRAKYVKKMHEIIKPNGKLVGVLFQKELYQDHPPFGGFKPEYVELFESKFQINIMETAYNSIPPRKNSELFINLTPK